MCYAWSDDLGRTWKGSKGDVVAKLKGEEERLEDGKNVATSILPPGRGGSNGARAFEIPMGSGILNQEAQTTDGEGGFWALNRENRSGEQKWVVYGREFEGATIQIVLDESC